MTLINVSYADGITLGKGVNILHKNITWVADIVNAKNQMQRLQDATNKESSKIPKGKKYKYDVVTKGNKFLFIARTDKPQLRPGGAKTAGQIEITGK